ncbi:hypothetical protein EON65_34075 [archaeon]|nr:MAG: hypothetical protein EON65_34075 [archaeon]
MSELETSINPLSAHMTEMRASQSKHSSFNLSQVDLFSDSHEERKSLLTRDTKVCFCIPASWIILPPEGEEVHIKNSNQATIFLLLNTMIGSGIVVQAYVFSQAGIVATIFEYIIVGIMMYQGVVLCIRSADKAKIFHYAQLAEYTVGNIGRYLIDVSIVINNAGALLSYILIIGTLSSDVLQTFSGCNDNDWYCNAGFLTLFPIIFFTIPLCLIRNFGHLALISYISIAVIVSIIFLVLIGGPVRAVYYTNDDDRHVKTGSFIGCIQTVGDIVFALGYITAIFHAYDGMQDKNVPAFTHNVFVTQVAGVLMCFIIGLVGYLCFLDNTETNILENFTGDVGAVFKIGLIVHLILYIPGDFVIFRASLLKLCDRDVQKQNDFEFVTQTLSLIAFITLIAIILQVTVPNGTALNAVINVSGGIAGSVVYFIVPGLCGKRLFPEEPQTVYLSYALIGFGVVIMILVLVGTALS